MSSFFGKLKSGNEAKGASSSSTPSKKDPNAPQPTPLERMLQNAGPLRDDGSDKFFGLENFGNTCYCNSILQCLYYTPPFREQVLSYPQRATSESITRAAANAPPRNRTVQPNRTTQPLTPGGQPKPEDKESPEHKKKLALAAGPVVNMSYQNSASYEMEESLFSSLKDIFEAIVIHQNRHGVVSPTRFLEVLRKENEMFRSAMHQDAHEFFNLVLNSIIDTIEDREKQLVASKPAVQDTETATEKMENGTISWPSVLPSAENVSGSKWLRDMFEGTMTSETRCLTCETVSQRDEAFLDLSVDLEQHSSVTSCLNRFSEEEMLCERNKFHCDNCGGLQEAEKRMKIKKLPEVLALHLKRFKYTEDLQRLQKLHHKVVYPYHLRLFNTTDDADDPDRLYGLYAVVVHIGGGPYHGHYVSIIKTQDRGWLLFDDEMVEPVDQSFVRNFFGEKQGMASAYVLFYKHTTTEEVRKEQNLNAGHHPSQMVADGLVTRGKDSTEIQRIHTTISPLSPSEADSWTNLDHAITAPPMSPNGHVDPPKATMHNILSPTISVLNKKDKVREEKDRKAAEKVAEKEREKAEKARQKDLEQKLKDAQKKQSDEIKSAVEASKMSKTSEDQRNGLAESVVKEAKQTNGASSKDIFRRSKSFKFGSLGRKDKTVLNEDTSNGAVTEESATEGKDEEREAKKRNRFSLRKKSFNFS